MPEEPTKQPTEFKTGYYIHNEGVYSLNISIEDRHIALTSYPWSYKQGSNTQVSIFDLTIEDIQNLGNRILEQAFIIKQVIEESRKKGGK